MELFNAVKEKAADLSLKAAKKSGEFVQTVKSNFTIADKQAEKSKLLKELGSMVFDAYKKERLVPMTKLLQNACSWISVTKISNI